MIAVWKIDYQGTVKTITDWGFAQPVITRKNQDIDELTLNTDPDDAATDAAIFARGVHLRLLRNSGEDGAVDVCWFVGRVESINRRGGGSNQVVGYGIKGLWWYLEHTIYQQAWVSVNAVFSRLTSVEITSGPLVVNGDHLILNRSPINQEWSVADQIDSVLTFINLAYQNTTGIARLFQWNKAEFPNWYLPWEECRSLVCAEVIRRQLRWFLDVIWLDYSTEPVTIRFKDYAAICAEPSSVKTYVLGGDDDEETWNFEPRYNLQVPEVVLRYEYLGTVDGESVLAIVLDQAPAGAVGIKPQAIVQTIDMRGVNVTTIKQPVAVLPIDAASTDKPTQLAWWIAHVHELSDPSNPAALNPNIIATAGQTELVKIENVVVPTALPNELKQGTLCAWMVNPPVGGASGVAVSGAHVVVTADLSYSLKNATAGKPARWIGKKQVKVKIVATNAVSQTYGTTASVTPAEPHPIGLAAAILANYSVLQWEGALSYVEDEVSGKIDMGHVVNVTGGLAEWATMKALVQTVTQDFEEGRTEVTVGPPRHLGVQDFIEMFRSNRWRQTWTNPAVRAGELALGGDTELGADTNRENTVAETPQSQRHEISDPTYAP